MGNLKGFQKKYLRGLSHSLKPVVLIGQRGLTDKVLATTEEALAHHELIKIKFNEHKEKEDKAAIIDAIAEKTGAEPVGTIGHTALLYRRQQDPEKRKIQLPTKTDGT